MDNDSNFDETAFHTLWAGDVDPLTAAAASVRDTEPQPAARSGRFYSVLGLIIGVVLYVLWLLIF